jgi:hypothetical protein
MAAPCSSRPLADNSVPSIETFQPLPADPFHPPGSRTAHKVNSFSTVSSVFTTFALKPAYSKGVHLENYVCRVSKIFSSRSHGLPALALALLHGSRNSTRLRSLSIALSLSRSAFSNHSGEDLSEPTDCPFAPLRPSNGELFGLGVRFPPGLYPSLVKKHIHDLAFTFSRKISFNEIGSTSTLPACNMRTCSTMESTLWLATNEAVFPSTSSDVMWGPSRRSYPSGHRGHRRLRYLLFRPSAGRGFR